jgi:hypothetical protein
MLRWLYRNEKLSNPDPPDVAEIKREIQIWQRTKASLHAVGGVSVAVIVSVLAGLCQEVLVARSVYPRNPFLYDLGCTMI